ncbi:hypothetical protein QO002_001070 [Pararhizobium capsulatum DSM 1112]|uniref:Uncharacterized protein n=1 Tax=Pararhizobium capsulatum DSM 1112 TaxID=1121113 RepID=A0ABU0BLQ1_9HYPH|nr:hypothetical protein [Pararhizobium capsulatum]MDQ0318932.1 hypothetical protein [Pararhizobium capsulatum DSM 1112]
MTSARITNRPAKARPSTLRQEQMQENRYEIQQERDGSWTVLDTLTGLPAASDGRDLTKLDQNDARDIADVLNEDALCHRDSPLV